MNDVPKFKNFIFGSYSVSFFFWKHPIFNSHASSGEKCVEIVKTLHVKFFPFGSAEPVWSVTVNVRNIWNVPLFPFASENRKMGYFKYVKHTKLVISKKTRGYFRVFQIKIRTCKIINLHKLFGAIYKQYAAYYMPHVSEFARKTTTLPKRADFVIWNIGCSLFRTNGFQNHQKLRKIVNN